MKTAVILLAISLTVLAVLACGCTTTAPAAPAKTTEAAIPNLVGTWTGTSVGHIEGSGYDNQGAPKYVITEQQGRAFTGFKTYRQADGMTGNETFSGVITRTGDIYIVDHKTGFMDGQMIGQDEMELVYLDDAGTSVALIVDLVRQKS